MAYKRILSIQDISCFGQCSTTVALPVISACGHETVILPTCVLSTHTGGFTGFTVHDLGGDMSPIAAHWKKEGISFDAIYTGYLGTVEMIDCVLDIIRDLLKPDGRVIVDPAMADNGKLYPAFDMEYVAAMRRLCAVADVVLPNMTEARLLNGEACLAEYSPEDVRAAAEALCAGGAKAAVITGTGFSSNESGVTVFENGELSVYSHIKYSRSYHGTGDIYSSAFAGAWMSGMTMADAAKLAADYVVRCIAVTLDDDSHRYGVKFEKELGFIAAKINA